MADSVIGLGLDPGKVNFGWALVAAKSLDDYTLLDSGILYTIKSQDHMIESNFIREFIEETTAIVVLGEPSLVAIERFHPRGTFTGIVNQMEYVNVSIGAIMDSLAHFKGIQVIAQTASTWKRNMYKGTITHKDWFPDAFNEHAADAGCIALHAMWKSGLISKETK